MNVGHHTEYVVRAGKIESQAYLNGGPVSKRVTAGSISNFQGR